MESIQSISSFVSDYFGLMNPYAYRAVMKILYQVLIGNQFLKQIIQVVMYLKMDQVPVMS